VKRFILAVLIFGLVVTMSGCGDGGSTPKPAVEAGHKHQHVPPHGGTAVELGRDEFHLELVADFAAGRLTAYVLDGELEQFIRVPVAAFQVVAKVGGAEQTLTFNAVSNVATGEKAGDTSQFEAVAGWLKATTNFDASLKELIIRGKAYRDVKFNFPKGNE
jgi:hypothetical protein